MSCILVLHVLALTHAELDLLQAFINVLDSLRSQYRISQGTSTTVSGQPALNLDFNFSRATVRFSMHLFLTRLAKLMLFKMSSSELCKAYSSSTGTLRL